MQPIDRIKETYTALQAACELAEKKRKLRDDVAFRLVQEINFYLHAVLPQILWRAEQVTIHQVGICWYQLVPAGDLPEDYASVLKLIPLIPDYIQSHILSGFKAKFNEKEIQFDDLINLCGFALVNKLRVDTRSINEDMKIIIQRSTIVQDALRHCSGNGD